MLSSIPSLLFGAITVTYTAVPLELKTAPGPYTSDTVIGAKLGTLEVQITEGSVIHSPAWGTAGEVASGVPLTGPMKSENGYSTSTHYFTVMSVAYIGGVTKINRFNDTYIPIYENKCTVSNSFSVELWLVNTDKDKPNTTVNHNHRPASDFQAGSVYTLPSDFAPYFSFISAKEGNTNVNAMINNDGTPNSSGSYVSVNGVEGGADNTPIIESSGYSDPDNPGEPVTYGDPTQIVSYSVFLSEQTKTFNLSEAVGTNRKDVNTMTITVSNGIAGADYSQKVIFTDLTPVSTSAEFRMLPEESGPNPIPFKLYFDSTEVVKGEAITWSSLQNGSSNTKTIRIGGIDQNVIDSLASGTYSDTINVEIQNL